MASDDRNSSKYKKYVAAIEKNLASFDAINEWADFISFLSRLQKTLATHPHNSVPHKITVCKRLAQCLNPALPSGVHQKALEIYAVMFRKISPTELALNLPIYSYGIFSFFHIASMNVKPLVLDLIKDFFIPLGSDLLPCLKSLILAILPGLEEESSEFYTPVTSILNSLRDSVKPVNFYRSMWMCLLLAPQFRISALNYFAKEAPNNISEEKFIDFCGNDKELVVRAICATVSDKEALVVRSMLEILVTQFPLEQQFFAFDSLVLISKSILNVLLRRDISLNRRVHAWHVGNNVEKRQICLDVLVAAVRDLLMDPTGGAKPYKILVSLMDKAEIGMPLINVIFLDIVTSVQQNIESGHHMAEEVSQSANIFFGLVDLNTIWTNLFTLIQTKFPDPQDVDLKVISIVEFSVTSLQISDEDALQHHIPLFFAALVHRLYDGMRTFGCRILPHLPKALDVCCFLHQLIPQNVFVSSDAFSQSLTTNPYSLQNCPPDQFLNAVEGAFLKPETASFFELSRTIVQQSLYRISFILNMLFKEIFLDSSKISAVFQITEGYSSRLYSIDARKSLSQLYLLLDNMGQYKDVFNTSCYPLIHERLNGELLQNLAKSCYLINDVDILLSNFKAVKSLVDSNFASLQDLQKYMSVPQIMEKAWSVLDAHLVGLHHRIVQTIWIAYSFLPTIEIERFIAASLNQGTIEERLISADKFITFWRISDSLSTSNIAFMLPLCVMFNFLKSDNTNFKKVARVWVGNSIINYSRVLDPLILFFFDSRILRKKLSLVVLDDTIQSMVYEQPFNYSQVEYALQCLLHMCELSADSFFRYVFNNSMRPADFLKNTIGKGELPRDMKYGDFIFYAVSLFLFTEVVETSDSAVISVIDSIQLLSAKLLCIFVEHEIVSTELIANARDFIMFKLSLAMVKKKLDLETWLLNLMRSTVMISKSFDFSGPNDETEISGKRSSHTNSFFLKLLSFAINDPFHDALSPIWIHFILTSVPYLKNPFRDILSPLLAHIRAGLSQLAVALHAEASHDLRLAETRILSQLSYVHRIYLFCLSDGSAVDNVDVSSPTQKTSFGLRILSFGRDSDIPLIKVKVKDEAINHMNPIISSLFSLLVASKTPISPEQQIAVKKYLDYQFAKIDTKIKKMMSDFYSLNGTSVLESLLYVWSQAFSSSRENERKESINVLLNLIKNIKNASQTEIITLTLDIFKTRASLFSSRERVSMGTDGDQKLPDVAILNFLEIYTKQVCSQESLSDSWIVVSSVIREFVASPSRYRTIFLPLFKWLYEFMRGVNFSGLEEKKGKDVFELFSKVFENCVLLAAKFFEQNAWSRRRDTVESRKSVPSAPTSPDESDEVVANSTNQNRQSQSNLTTILSVSDDVSINIIEFMTDTVVPNIRYIISDSEKICNMLGSIVYYLIATNGKGRSSDPAYQQRMLKLATELLYEISKLSFALKTWKKEYWDIFMDSKFFAMSYDVAVKRREILHTALLAEPEKITDILAKITVSSSPALFSSKDFEIVVRCTFLKRLAFTLFCGEQDQYLPFLPQLQGKIVELFRMPFSKVHGEIFLLMRIVYLRISNQHLGNLWPIVISEVITLYDRQLQGDKFDSEELYVFFCICKFLDILFVLPSDEALTSRWIFITESTDVVDHTRAIGLIDLLKIKWAAAKRQQDPAFTLDKYNAPSNLVQKRRPILNLSKIASIHDLEPFMFSIGPHVIHSALKLSDPDWPFIEEMILYEFLEDSN